MYSNRCVCNAIALLSITVAFTSAYSPQHRALLTMAVRPKASPSLLKGQPPKPMSRSERGLSGPLAAQSSLEQDFDSDFDEFIAPLVGVGITAMRLGTCALMVHHGFDKIQNVDGFSANVVAKFFGFLPGDPHFWTLSAAATQIGGAGLLSIGLFSRPVALSMLGTMLAAVIFHLLNTGIEGFPLAVVKAHSYNYELAAMYVIVLGYFAAAGAGPLSVDEKILGGELRFYQGLIEKFSGEDEQE